MKNSIGFDIIVRLLQEEKGGSLMEREIIESKAFETLTKANDKGDAAIDIIGLAKSLGFIVGNAELCDDEDGFIIVDESKDNILGQPTNKLIGVRADQSIEWKRFVIAHEIGHYILHYDRDSDNGMYAHRDHKKGKDSTENEADFFAANLLMPKERFLKNYEELRNNRLSLEEKVIILAKRFCVTEIMTRRRFEELGINE